MLEKSGKALRLARLLKSDGNPLFVVPLDHTVTDGPFTDNSGYAVLLEALAANGADAVVIHKGRLRQIPDSAYAKLSVIVHISASTKYAADVSHKYQVAEVEDCLRRRRDQRPRQRWMPNRRPANCELGIDRGCVRPPGRAIARDALPTRRRY
jgi:DhnA family fructose-bisphosphate aldolase class Ia